MNGNSELMNSDFQIKVQELDHCSIHLPQVWSNLFLDYKNLNNLVFELKFSKSLNDKGPEKKVYVSWTGQTSSLSNKDSVVLDRLFLKSLNIDANKHSVKIKPLNKVKIAKSIEVEPVTSDDWEILQLNAGLLEASFLLQCRVVSLNQIVPIRVSNGAHIKIRVINSDPSNLPCLRLTENSEIHVKPLERKINPKDAIKSKPQFPNMFLRTVFENEISDFVPILPNELTVGIHPNSLTTPQRLEALSLQTSDFPTQAQISLITRSHPEPTNTDPKTSPNGTIDGSSKDNPHCKFTVGTTQQVQTLPTKLRVTIHWSTAFPLGHAVLGTALAKSLNVLAFYRIYLDFAHFEPQIKPNQIKFIPVFPSAANSDAKGKSKSTGKVSTANPISNRNKMSTASKSWIFDLALAWIKAQPSSKQQMILTHGMVLVLPDNHTERRNSQAVIVDLGLPITSTEPSSGYVAVSPADLLKMHLVESDQPYFTTNLTYHNLVNISSSSNWLTQPLPQLGGVDQLIDKTVNAIMTGVAYGEVKASLGLYPSSGVLVCGSKGSGKSVILQTVLQKLARDRRTLSNVIQINCNLLVNERVATVRDKLQSCIEEASMTNPSLIVFDDLDTLIPCEMEHMDSFRYRQLAECLVAQILKARKSFPYLAIVATANQPQAIHQYLLQSHAFTDTLTIPPPNKLSRQKVLKAIVESSTVAAVRDSCTSLDFLQVAAATEGYLPSDLKTLTERAVHQAAIRQMHQLTNTKPDTTTLQPDPLLISTTDYINAQTGYTPVSLRGVKLQQSGVQWSDVGGLMETRKVLRETLEWPIKYQRIFASCPLRLRSGLLLFGYPGCGKTLLASAVARECQLNFITVKGPEILNKYIGASEQSVRDLFQRAQAAKPCVLFFDEFESIAPRRGHDSTGVTDRVVNQLLTQMDGAEGLEGVYVLAATSRPDLIDPALLRPGRLDKALLCGIPTSEERLSILEAHATKFHLDSEVRSRLPELADKCPNFTGADLQALLYNAHLEAIHTSIDDTNLLTDPQTNGTTEGTKSSVTFHTFQGTTLFANKSDRLPPPKQTLTKAESDFIQTRLHTILNPTPNLTNKTKLNHSGNLKSKTTTICWSHVTSALASTQPSLPQTEIERLDKIYGEFLDGKGDPKKVGKKSTLG